MHKGINQKKKTQRFEEKEKQNKVEYREEHLRLILFFEISSY